MRQLGRPQWERVFQRTDVWLQFFLLQNLQRQGLYECINYFQKYNPSIIARNTNAIILIILFMKVWLLLLSLISFAASLTCQAYIYQLVSLYYSNKTQFGKQVAGYIASSGRLVDDMGFPHTCIKNSKNTYFTAELEAVGVENQYTVYLGVCFTSLCNTEEMNQNGGIILNTLLNISTFDNSTIDFYQPSLQAEATSGSIVCMVLLIILILISMKEGIQRLFKGCIKQTKAEEDELAQKYEIQFTEDYDPTLLVIQQKQGFFKRCCIFTKITEYWEPQQSTKIVAFSSIRILAVPLAFYGYLFYLCNLGSLNYFSFNKEIYLQMYAKIAISSYYLPDILFFISGFIFARKGFTLIQIQNKPIKPLISNLSRKLWRLYPLYLIIIIIYWQISPTLHSGPIWYEYQAEAQQCDSSWWRVLLLIDNWFENGCYNFAWFIPAEIQLALINIFILLVFAKKEKFGLIALGIALLSSWILVLTISSPLPSSLETTLSFSAEKYFKSTYSHLPFYLLGTLSAYLAHNERTKIMLQKLTQNNILKAILLIVGAVIIVLVVDRPEVWDNVLGFQLGLSRTGVFVGMYFLMFGGIFGGKVRKTYLHKLSALSLGVLMMGGIIIGCAFWGSETFPYLDGNYLLQYTITNILIAIPVGGFIAALVWPKPQKQESITI